jgi:hypothetical protein
MNLETTNTIVATLTLMLEAGVLLAFSVILFKKRFLFAKQAHGFLERFAIPLVFSLALFGSLGTLYYSEILLLEPCVLCWWQRIMLYPQVVIFGLVLFRRETLPRLSLIVFSALGAGIALYHHLLQMFPNALPCPSVGVSCAQRFVFEYGHVTFPWMAFMLFLALCLLVVMKRS